MLHINRFLDRLRTAESRQQRDVILTVQEARDLHADITRLLLRVEQQESSKSDTQITSIEVSGGSF